MIIIDFMDIHNVTVFNFSGKQAMHRIKNKNQLNLFTVALFTFILLSSIIFFGTFHSSESSEPPISVFVSIEPQVFFVSRIGGDRVSVHALVPPGKSPETYSPTPMQMAKLAKSKLFFRIGVPFEESLIQRIKRTAKKVKIVDTQKGIPLRKMEGHVKEHPESNDTNVSHDHVGGYDPHIWLSPVLVQKQAKTICDALISIDSEGKQFYEANCRAFLNDLDALHQRIKKSLASVKGRAMFVYHPAFGYFTDAYGLKQIAVETEGKIPKGKNLSQFIKQAKQENVRVVFVQPQFDQNAARKIANAIHGEVVPLDPLCRDYIKNMEAMADAILRALTKPNS